MRLEPSDIRNHNLLKHYRIIRKWACKNNDLNDADLELLIYFDCMDLFTREDFKIGTYSYSWDNRRWNRLPFTNVLPSFGKPEIHIAFCPYCPGCFAIIFIFKIRYINY